MEQGFGAASMDAIAKVATVSKATLYAHFESKEQLFADMVRAECVKHARLMEAAECDERDPRAALTEIGAAFLGLLMSAPALAVYRMVVSETPRFPELGRVFFASGPARVRERILAYLAEAGRRGLLSVPDPAVAAEQFIGLLMVPLHMHRLLGVIEEPDEARLRVAVDRAVETFMRAYGRGG